MEAAPFFLFFLRGLGIVTRESKVLWFLRSSLSPSSLEWSFGNEQKQKGLQQTEALGDQKRKPNFWDSARSVYTQQAEMTTNERWEVKRDLAGLHLVLLLMFSGVLCRPSRKVAQVSEEEGCGEAQCHSAQLVLHTALLFQWSFRRHPKKTVLVILSVSVLMATRAG